MMADWLRLDSLGRVDAAEYPVKPEEWLGLFVVIKSGGLNGAAFLRRIF